MSGPKLSVVTVCYNAEKTLRRTIDSVLAQSFGDFEYLVVDGGSSDGTLAILESYGSRLSFFSEPDKGIYDAMNKGVVRARGEWIHLLNADDWYVAPDVLERAVPHLDPQRTNYFDLIRVYADGSTVLQSRTVKPWMLYISAFLPHPGLIVSRQQYRSLGAFDDTLKIAADHDFILRMVKRYPVKHVPIPLTCMDQGGFSATDLAGSLDEFALVTKRHGLPSAAAEGLRLSRRLWWKARTGARQRG
ncbi:glycosyltransferase family 2 protein [Afifella sp. IM 167]|uniref:glycosyltransferase family 2 protein n=1 Tax=Afifella sp. IM 167 TaxID=2033586 RepID=UPI001CCE4C46|nr:glycosyltransferase family 2 protein [Afifella sp. IM 167]MBZ8134255.1 glycosyltransferase [Afifella sp. IM 167]